MSEKLTSEAARPGQLREFWYYFRENRGAVIGLYIFIAFALCAAFAPLLSPYDPSEQFRDHILQPPFWQEGGSWAFPLGTDPLGRDMLSRLIEGARYSFFVGIVVVTVAASGGIIVGLIAGFSPKWLDTIIMRIMDIILAFPSLLLALVLVAILGPSLTNAMIAIAIVLQPHYVRLTRASVMSELQKDYVTSARTVGAGLFRLMFITVLPNCLAPIIVQGALSFSTAILDAAALGFLGMGAQPPTPEWGTMLAEAREFILRAWWVVTFPGLAILVTVLAINLMGDGLRDALDPKLKRS
ncbi:ABC transporter permease subunit [Falsihalocynthiibacter sp. SS001]|uniref:ABC transporter permease subunit n=1 Tax=Falsihalocynthiibacter sp. SS001 TaxID=3349698 RepID=UPI0036D41B80